MERIDVQNTDYETLVQYYQQEVQAFKEALLAGEPWEKLQDQKNYITELSIAVHRKRPDNVNPAEHFTRVLNQPYQNNY